MNYVRISGKITQDPRVYAGEHGVIVNINVKFKEPGKERASYVNLVTFGEVSDQVEGYGAGDTISVEGRLSESVWKKDDKWNRKLQVVVDRVLSDTQPESQPDTEPEFKSDLFNEDEEMEF